MLELNEPHVGLHRVVLADVLSLPFQTITAGVAAVFVPLPSAVDDHQTANAKFLANIGAAKICPQTSMTPESLKELLLPLMNRQLLSEMAVKARQQAQPDATQHVVRLIQAL
jgi:UDP-N-acetylglucosamine--N-acetylmuramyl-(pentapeptide) pyrophosphoryl-undecaprenol N-acetylglucosamine transferase